MNQLTNRIKDISKLCFSYNVRHLYAFGSILTDQYNSQSDIDLIVDFLPIDSSKYADSYFDLKFSLEDMLHRKIDLIEEKTRKNPYFLEAISEKKQLIYGN